MVEFAVVLAHRTEESLLVANDKVVDEVVVDFPLAANLNQWSLGNFEQYRSGPQILLYLPLTIHIEPPVTLPLLLFRAIQQH